MAATEVVPPAAQVLVILVDTSAWIEAFLRAHRDEAARLRGLLDAGEVAIALPIRIELSPARRGLDRLADHDEQGDRLARPLRAPPGLIRRRSAARPAG